MKILFVDTVHPYLWSELTSAGHQCQEAYQLSKEEIESIVSSFDGIVIRSRFSIDKRFIDVCKNLKFIARAGSGLENIDVEYAKTKNIHCVNAPEGNRQAVAEHALGMLLSLLNNLHIANNEVKNGVWEREKNRGIEISGKTIGIIGYGNNGSAFAKTLSGLNCQVIAFDKYLNEFKDDFALKVDMSQMFEQCDILSLHVPLTAETEHLVNSDFISKFKKNFYLINTARGKCVDSNTVLKAIQSKKILGACLDVNEFEKISFENILNVPQVYIDLLESEKVILSPHVAGWTKESHQKISEVLFQKIKSLK
jgi:D-3-phosphoglycerate dehydrogenase